MTHRNRTPNAIGICRFCSGAFIVSTCVPGRPTQRCRACAKSRKRAEKKLPGTVYFFEADGFDRIKIGFTRETVERRAQQLQVGCPAPIRVLHSQPGTMVDEKTFHRRFAKQRVPHTEWFVADAALKGFVEELRKIS